MKVELTASARFRIEITYGLVRELIELSKRHYDGECRMASTRIGRPIFAGAGVMAQRNGLITTWLDRFEHGADDNDTENVFASWNDLDLVAKICEHPPNNGEFDGWRRSRAFAFCLSKIFHTARMMLDQWKTAFVV